MNISKERKLFIIGALMIAALYIWRLPYGYAELDEAFYMTVPFRLLKGDTLFVDEWHVTQLSGMLLTPFMAIQRLLFGSTEGVALNFRIFWLLEHLLVMGSVYLLLEKRNAWAAMAAAWIYGLFTPFGIMALSYNSMGVDAMLLLVLLFYLERDCIRADIGKGFLMAALVLCNPYTISIYLILMLVAAANKARGKISQFSTIHVLYWHIGILILLVPFVIHLVSGLESLPQLVEHLTYILKDPAHNSKNFLLSNAGWMHMLITWNPEFFRAYAALMIAGLVIRKIRPYVLGMIALLCAYYVLRDARYFKYIWDGNSMVMFCYFAGAAAFLLGERKNLHTLCWTYLLPMCFSICVNMASNQGLRSVLVSFLPGCCLGIMGIAEYYQDHRLIIQVKNRKIPILAAALVAAFAVQMCAQSYVRLTQVFWEWEPPAVLTAKIEFGPFKGLRTIPQKKEEYERLSAEIEDLGDLTGKKIAFFKCVPAGVLIADAQLGAPSGWMEFEELDDERLLQYYRLNPENEPDFLFVDKLTADAWSEEEYIDYAEQQGYRMLRSNDRCVILEKI